MKISIASRIGFGLAVLGVGYLLENELFFTLNGFVIGIQLIAVGLMLWARITFGLRSFHADANTTQGTLVTKGPYRWLRHPIYAAALLLFWSCLIAYPQKETLIGLGLITSGMFLRIFLEEHSLKKTYGQEYIDYSNRTKRIIPFVF